MRRTRHQLFSFLTAALALIAMRADASPDCLTCIETRVGPPIVVRGPSSREPDAPLSILRLANGRFRAFTSNATTFAVEGSTPFSMGGPGKIVLEPGAPGSISDCGRWLTSLMPSVTALYALVHNEKGCEYRLGQTHKSMSVMRSSDEGLSWTDLGLAISSSQPPASGKSTGEGDCTAINGGDGYFYAYCLRLSDWRATVARAPASDPSPSQWRKWNGTAWTQPAINSDGAPLQKSVGVNAAFWPANNLVLLLESAASLHLAVSRDKINFERVQQPVIRFDASEWKRPARTDLYAYPTLTGENGSSDVTNKAILSYTYVPPGADFTKRHLVMHDVRLSMTAKPRAAVSLSRWARDGRSWTTAGPPIEEGQPRYAADKHLGYLLTARPDTSSVEIEECMRQTTDGPLYTLAKTGTCAARGAERRRAAGFLLESEEASFAPLYECRAGRESFIYSNRSDCEGLGDHPVLLGFLLSR